MSQNDLYYYEILQRKKGYHIIAGIDEAGRGPLAGPVVAAACIFPEHVNIDGINDSKKLNERARKELYLEMRKHPDVQFGIGIIEPERIDEINILQATFEAMKLAVMHLPLQPDFLLIDGNRAFPHPIPLQTIVGGDAKSISIAAASIIAKYTRDEIMRNYHLSFPEYGFDKHKGYGTKMHKLALEKYGMSKIHRKSFQFSKVQD